MATIMHVRPRGHKCRNPWQTVTAGYVQSGKPMKYKGYEVFYAVLSRMYVVCRTDSRGDHYEFTNFNCAAAKLAELGDK